MQAIHQVLGIPHKDKSFTFEGRKFNYYAEDPRSRSLEAIYTKWAEGCRSAVVVSCNDVQTRQQLAVLLAHKFRKGVSAIEREDIIYRAKLALSASV